MVYNQLKGFRQFLLRQSVDTSATSNHFRLQDMDLGCAVIRELSFDWYKQEYVIGALSSTTSDVKPPSSQSRPVLEILNEMRGAGCLNVGKQLQDVDIGERARKSCSRCYLN
jgi:hypothetical protein